MGTEGEHVIERPRFHLAFLVTSLDATRHFYRDVLGCSEGRSAERWIDFDFFGHQISAHLIDEPLSIARKTAVDGDGVPIPHFGLILQRDDWDDLRRRLEENETSFILEPRIRFKGQPGEQATMFLSDPSGNHLEFKSFGSDTEVFAVD